MPSEASGKVVVTGQEGYASVMSQKTAVKSRRFITYSAEETIKLGRKLAAEWSALPGLRPQLILLIGDLGSGKTTFTKGVVSGICEIEEDQVTSPTFTLVQEYGEHEDAKIFHVDLYRVEDSREVESLGLDDLFSHNSTVLVEWGEKLTSLAGAQRRLEVHLECLCGDQRRITIESINSIESRERV